MLDIKNLNSMFFSPYFTGVFKILSFLIVFVDNNKALDSDVEAEEETSDAKKTDPLSI